MNYTRSLTLDVNLEGEMPALRVKQSDINSRFVRIRLRKDGEDYSPDSLMQILFRCRKPDGHAVILDSMYEDSEEGRYFVILNNDGTITVELVPQVSAVPGKCYCDICLLKNGKVLSSIPFLISVVPMPDIADTITSADEFHILSEALTDIASARQLIEMSESGELDGATFTPSVNSAGMMSWTNDKGLENPAPFNLAREQTSAKAENGALVIVPGTDAPEQTSQASGYIDRIDPGNGTKYPIVSGAYAVCNTAGDVAAKTVDMPGFRLFTGVTIHVRFIYENTASSPTLNVNGTGAKSIVIFSAVTPGASSSWFPQSVLTLTYDGTHWSIGHSPQFKTYVNLYSGNNTSLSNNMTTSGNTYLKVVQDNSVKGTAHLVPGDNMEITSDTDGNVTFAVSGIVDMIYPVGSIYISTNNVSPATLFGGTWSQLENRFLLGAGTSYTAGNTGGEASVTLTAEQSGLPAHKHTMTHGHGFTQPKLYRRKIAASGTARYAFQGNSTTNDGETVAHSGAVQSYSGDTGSNTAANASQAHNNMPPYLVVYMWERTA